MFEVLDSPRLSKSEARAARRAKRVVGSSAGGALYPRNPTQREYIDRLRRGENAFGIGPAGTGKTYIPARLAARKLIEGSIEKIIITRVTVAPKRHQLGFLPGRLEQKMAPWLVPVFDGIKAEMSAASLAKFQQEKRIEVVPFEYCRGRTFSDAYVILDEAQNATFADLKLLLTRIGENCQVVVTGDLDQIDIDDSGLFKILAFAEAYKVPMAVVRFHSGDVVRSEFTKAWVEAFAADTESHNNSSAVAILDRHPEFLKHRRNVMNS